MNLAYNVDCMKAMGEIPDKYFDLAVVDPPTFPVLNDVDTTAKLAVVWEVAEIMKLPRYGKFQGQNIFRNYNVLVASLSCGDAITLPSSSLQGELFGTNAMGKALFPIVNLLRRTVTTA